MPEVDHRPLAVATQTTGAKKAAGAKERKKEREWVREREGDKGSNSIFSRCDVDCSFLYQLQQ